MVGNSILSLAFSSNILLENANLHSSGLAFLRFCHCFCYGGRVTFVNYCSIRLPIEITYFLLQSVYRIRKRWLVELCIILFSWCAILSISCSCREPMIVANLLLAFWRVGRCNLCKEINFIRLNWYRSNKLFWQLPH